MYQSKPFFCGLLALLFLCLWPTHTFSRQIITDNYTVSNSTTNVDKSTNTPDYRIVTHTINKLGISVSNMGTFGTGCFQGTPIDDLTGLPPSSCNYPYPGSQDFLFAGGLWIGGTIGNDTLVSTAIDGWHYIYELAPGNYSPLEYHTIHNLIDVPAVSEQDIVAHYCDTTSDINVVGFSEFDGRLHIPLELEITQSSYAWNYAYAEDFVIIDYKIENIGSQSLQDIYAGIFVDADIAKLGGGSDQGMDDISGFLYTYPHPLFPPGCFEDTINIAWSADNDGRYSYGLPCPSGFDLTSVFGVKILQYPCDTARMNFNWWASNQTMAYDFGPRKTGTPDDPFRDFGGFLGTPEGDRNKYYIMRHDEFDYDQMFTAVDHTSDGWLSPPENAVDAADGNDTKFLLSFGPVSIEPGESVPLTIALVAGENLHTNCTAFEDMFDPLAPQAYYDQLNFGDLAQNAIWASWFYDYPGYDTDGDGDSGKYIICNDQKYWYRGDGESDLTPKAAVITNNLRLTPQNGKIQVRWNGLMPEVSIDQYLTQCFFEGYTVHYALNNIANDYVLAGSYDIENYFAYEFYLGDLQWHLQLRSYSLQDIIDEYGIDNPLDYSMIHPLVIDDDMFYFVQVYLNQSDLSNPDGIHKVYPEQSYPSSFNLGELSGDELTDDGFLKYFEYEFTIDNPLPDTVYYVIVNSLCHGLFYPDNISSKPIPGSPDSVRTLGTTDIENDNPAVLPQSITLHQNYPNPFNPSTVISFDLPNRAVTTIAVFNTLGQTVRTFDLGTLPHGHHEIQWDGTNNSGKPVASGVYFYQLQAGDMVTTKKMTLLR